jgi:CDGSH-type Zn-finger protein
MAKERVSAAAAPIKIDVEAGKAYFWCSCGLSKTQPFCDGAHAREETGLAPVRWEALESRTVFFCACKKTQGEPLCDGSHARL